jgi:2-polyprenyl-6-hydroxyphenyl methylase/3-demethylubiquinone-9 3-methyltransferase
LRQPALAVFDTLPLAERWFVRVRLGSAPLRALAERAVGRDLLDVGCGHGVLLALLRERDRGAHLVGIDPDARKIAWARQSIGRSPPVELHACTIEQLAERQPAAFDTVLVADVLYLLSAAAWPPFLAAARRLLRPGGRLVLKEAEDDGSWRVTKALLQEKLMVHLLRRTTSSGAVGFAPRGVLLGAIETAGFAIDEVAPLARGYTTPHLLVVARAIDRAT